MGRPWLDAKEFKINLSDVTKALDKQIEKETSDSHLGLSSNNKKFSEKAFKLKSYEYADVIMDNYGESIFDKNNNLIGYKLNENEFVSIITYYNDENLLCNKVSIKEFDEINLSFKNELINSWVDIRTDLGFTREFNKKKYYYNKNNDLINVEITFSYPQFPLHKKDLKFSDKVGTIDLETYGNNLGTGYHEVYAAGFSIKNKTELFYIGENETSDDFIFKFFSSLFQIKKNLDGYVFYVHNLGRFDSVFILKALSKNSYFTINPTWKDNSILSITIKCFKQSIVLLDSLQLIPGSLDDILKSFNCVTQKGKFPYKAVNKNSLNYVGPKPAKNFYNNISDQEYNSIPANNWDLKKETLSYLKSDLEGLLEVIFKFKDNVQKKYQLNITSFKTLPGLALAVYTSTYIPSHLNSEFKTIKGDLEREIRTAYFGGNVDVFVNKVTKGYLYDMVSQYPKAMLMDRNKIFSTIIKVNINYNKI